MNCRVKTLFWGLVLLSAIALAEVKTSDSTVLSSYPKFILGLMSSGGRWQPVNQATSECKLTFSSPQLLPDKCLLDKGWNILEDFKSKLLFDFDISDHKKFQRLTFVASSGYQIRTLLALQSDQKRPLVILRLGVHGNVDEFLAERFLLRMYYQDLGYHVLAIESTTSHGYLSINSEFSIGAVEEALQTLYILKSIQSQQVSWSSQVTDIYLAGVSLSGAGILLATYLDENMQHQIKRTQLFCPLVQMEETFRYHFQAGIKTAALDFWNARRLKELKNKNPKLDLNLWPMLLDFKPRFVPVVFDWLNQTHAKPALNLEIFKKDFPDLKWPKDFVNHLDNSKNWSQLNQIQKFYFQTRSPIAVNWTANDPLVVNSLNSDWLLSQKQQGKLTHIQMTELKGLHCAIAGEYQWPFLVEYFRRQLK